MRLAGRAAAGQQLEPRVQPGQDLARCQRPEPHRGQLDGQRDPVQRPAHPRHRRAVAGVHREPGQHGRSPAREQPHRLISQQFPGPFPAALGRHRHRRDRDRDLPRHPEHVPAGRDDPQLRASAQQRVRHDRARVGQVLTPVQHQQKPPGLQVVCQRRQRPPGRLVRQPQRPRYLGHQQPGIPQPGQPGQPHPVPERPPRPGRHLQRQSGLADAARPGQRDQPRARQCVTDLGKLGPPPDELGQLTAQPPSRSRSTHASTLHPR
jgi:hypothetical protein